MHSHDPEKSRELTDFADECLARGEDPEMIVEKLRDEKHMPHQDADELVTALIADRDNRKRSFLISLVCGVIVIASAAVVVYFILSR